MGNPFIPSTDWRENVAPDEATRHARQAQVFADIQARKSQKYGAGRALHRKQITAARGTLEVLGGLPDFARHGVFASPGAFSVRVRLSNGGMDKASDRMPDIRGFALRVLGVEGDSALGNGPATSQDFLLINHEMFAFAGSDEFTGFVEAASHGNAGLLKYLFKRYGVRCPRAAAQDAGHGEQGVHGFCHRTAVQRRARSPADRTRCACVWCRQQPTVRRLATRATTGAPTSAHAWRGMNCNGTCNCSLS